MKIKSLLAFLSVIVVFGCNTIKQNPGPLYLNTSELQLLGIHMTDQGIFYKNTNPNWKQDNEKYTTLAFYLGDDNYLTTFHLKETDNLFVNSKSDSLLKTLNTTHNDFYLLLIGNIDGHQSLNSDLPLDMKLLPIAICMTDTRLPSRTDTVVVWFKPTETLNKILNPDFKMEDYLQTRPIAAK